MFYTFPVIKTLADVLPAIAGRDEFSVYERGPITVVNYEVAFPDTFPFPGDASSAEEARLWAIRRECRGLLFNTATGDIISRRFAKFYNINEKPETQEHLVDISLDHEVLDKLDGSMLSSFVIDDSVKYNVYSNGFLKRLMWATKRGPTEIAEAVEDFVVKSNVDYDGFSRECFDINYTPIFEYMSAQTQIVIRYPATALVLTAIRHLHTGEIVPYASMVEIADHWGIPVVASHGKITDKTAFIEASKNEEGIEGYVIRFANGGMLKIKNSWYMRIHKTKENLVFEKDVWKLILEGGADDNKPFLPEADRLRLENFEILLEGAIRDAAHKIETIVNNAKEQLKNSANMKKDFALIVIPTIDENIRPLAFSVFNGKSAFATITQYALNRCSTGTKIEEARHIIQVKPWIDTTGE